MYKIYFAGDLFDQKHITGNLLLAQRIEDASNDTYKFMLPQNWECSLHAPIDVRNQDILSIIQADLVLFNFDGPDLDSGTVVEFMMAKMLDIPSVLLRTDTRNGGCVFGTDWNLMALGFPRCSIVKHPALMMYNSLGLHEMHNALAQSIIGAFKKVVQEKSLLTSYEEIFTTYEQLIKLCGSNLTDLIPKKLLHEIVELKIDKGLYTKTAAASYNISFSPQHQAEG